MNAAEYARAQQKPLPPLRKLVRAVLHSLGVPITPAQTNAVALMLWRPTVKARAQNHRAAVRYVRSVDLGLPVPPASLYPFAYLEATIASTVENMRFNGAPVDEDTRTDVRAIEQARKAIEGPIVKHVLAPAREAVAHIGEDQAEPRYGWVRILTGPSSCAFCAMLASRGPVYTSKAADTGRGGTSLNVYHSPPQGGVCDCTARLVPREGEWEGKHAYLALDALWKDHGNLKAFRSAWDKQVKEGDTQQYLPASLKKAA